MPLSIKSQKTERLAREIASKTGDSITGSIEKALEEKLDQVNRDRSRRNLMSQLDEILQRMDRLPVLDSRTPEEIIGYDEHGLPR
jgi:antitoxin VapB